MVSNPYANPIDAEFDAFASLDTGKWDSPATVVGSTGVTLTPTTAGGEATFANAGSGTLGLSMLVGTPLKWGRNSAIMADIEVVTSTPNAAGSVEASLELYLDADNYIKFGPYEDGVGTIDDLGYLRWNRAGGGEQTLELTGLPVDNEKRTYIALLTNDYVILYVNGAIYKRLYFPEMVNFIVRLSAGTAHNSDVCDINFTDFYPYPAEAGITPFHLGMFYQVVVAASVASAQIMEHSVQTPGSGELDLTDTTAGSLEFTTANYGTVFDLSLNADTAKDTTGFEAKAAALTVLTVSVWQKVDGSYPTYPQDTYSWVKGSVDRNVGVQNLRCWADTKIAFQLDTTPAPETVEIPYSYVVETLKD